MNSMLIELGDKKHAWLDSTPWGAIRLALLPVPQRHASNAWAQCQPGLQLPSPTCGCSATWHLDCSLESIAVDACESHWYHQ
jgi:hypothetical protein